MENYGECKFRLRYCSFGYRDLRNIMEFEEVQGVGFRLIKI